MKLIEYAYRHFCTERFPLPNQIQRKQLEERMGVALPDDYGQFILEYNGGYFREPEITPADTDCAPDGLMFLSGISASHEESELGRPFYLALFEDNAPPKIVPIGRTGTGGLIVVVTEPEGRGQIYLKEAYGGFHFLADGIEEFFGLLREPIRS